MENKSNGISPFWAMVFVIVAIVGTLFLTRGNIQIDNGSASISSAGSASNASNSNTITSSGVDALATAQTILATLNAPTPGSTGRIGGEGNHVRPTAVSGSTGGRSMNGSGVSTTNDEPWWLKLILGD